MPQSNGRHLPAPLEAPSPVLDPDAVRAPVSHQLPPHQSKAGRVGDHLAAISADLREIVELRIDLLKAEVAEVAGKVEGSQDAIKQTVMFGAPGAVLALYLIGFILLTTAVGIGYLLGHLFWGLLIVTAVLVMIVVPLLLIAKKKAARVEYSLEEAVQAFKRLIGKGPDVAETDAATPGPPTRHQLQDLEREHARQSTT